MNQPAFPFARFLAPARFPSHYNVAKNSWPMFIQLPADMSRHRSIHTVTHMTRHTLIWCAEKRMKDTDDRQDTTCARHLISRHDLSWSIIDRAEERRQRINSSAHAHLHARTHARTHGAAWRGTAWHRIERHGTARTHRSLCLGSHKKE